MDASITSRRKQREKTWMPKLRTVYPYCLNNCLGDEYKKVGTHLLVCNKFPSLPRKYNRVSRGTIHKNNNSFSPEEFLIKLKHHLSPNLLDAPNFYRVSPLTMNEYNLKDTAVLLEDNPDDDRNSIYFQWYSLALDIIES